MSLSGNELSAGDKKLAAAKAPLNPNAAEFVPFALKSPSAGISRPDASSKLASPSAATNGRVVLGRSESSISNNSDDEAHQYWRCQLPDDITPDFKFMGMDDTQGISGLSLSSLSLNDAGDASGYVSSPGAGFNPANGNQYGEQPRHEYPSFTSFQPSVGKSWERQLSGNDHLLGRGGHGQSYTENPRHKYPLDMSNELLLEDNPAPNPLEYLASQFPGFAVESLAELYFANGGDLNLTLDMLTQLELQVDGGMAAPSLEVKTYSAPTLSALNFPALSPSDARNGGGSFPRDDPTSLFRSNSPIALRGAPDFASAVRKTAARDAGIWKYDKNSSADTNIGSSRGSQILGSTFNGGLNRGAGSTHSSPVWLETGAAVANLYSEMREEARDHARVRNAYFEQARQAYLIGNKALAKELSIKGQLHNMQMKAAHGKAQESIFRQRNSEMYSNARGRMIDLHGLHVSEALHFLKRELAAMRNAARVADQRLLVDICVGTGHHTRGSRTPARLPTAVQRYLLEEEGLEFSEPQPGLLRVVIR